MASKTCYGVFISAYLRRLKSKIPVSAVDIYIAMQSIDSIILKLNQLLAGNQNITKSEITNLSLQLADVIGYSLLPLVESTEHKNFTKKTIDALDMQYRRLIFDAGCADDINAMLKKPKQYPNATVELLNLLMSSKVMCWNIYHILLKNMKIDFPSLLNELDATT